MSHTVKLIYNFPESEDDKERSIVVVQKEFNHVPPEGRRIIINGLIMVVDEIETHVIEGGSEILTLRCRGECVSTTEEAEQSFRSCGFTVIEGEDADYA